jgi:hypothetical protein
VVRFKLGYMRELPFKPDHRACSGKYSLESNPEKHEKTPLAVATGNRFRGGES